MATAKKPIAKASNSKKPAIVATKAKVNPSGKIAAAKSVAVMPKKSAAKPITAAKKAAAKPATKGSTASPAKAAAAKKSIPAKKSVTATVAKNAPSRSGKAAPSKSAAKAATPKKSVAVKAAPPKPVPARKAAPAPAPKVKELKKAALPVEVLPKKETKAQKREAQKRIAAAVQRIQAKVAAATPKPQPKPAPMPTVMPAREDKKVGVVVAHRRLESKPKPIADEAGLTMVSYQPEYTRSILGGEDKDSGPTYRYSDEELNEFKQLIQGRLDTARRELGYQQGLITHRDATGAEDTENRYMNMEDGSGAMEREQLSQLASRQIQFINHLEKAMIRIENKTYGICRVTGKLIDKARLRAVPHATLSIEAKNTMNKK